MAGINVAAGANLGTFGWFTGAWVVMMLPSLAPTAARVAAVSSRRDPSPWVRFVAGYLLVWAAAGVHAYALFTFGRRLLAHEMAWRGGGHWRAAGTLAVAAPYELCRSSWHA
jgi:predicted metal-binding membrane protein